MRESRIEALLHERIEALGGLWRRVKWIGRIHAPDDFVALPGYYWTDRSGTRRMHNGYVGFIEAKATCKVPRPGQVREHNQLRRHGARVLVINTVELIDYYFPRDER